MGEFEFVEVKTPEDAGRRKWWNPANAKVILSG